MDIETLDKWISILKKIEGKEDGKSSQIPAVKTESANSPKGDPVI